MDRFYNGCVVSMTATGLTVTKQSPTMILLCHKFGADFARVEHEIGPPLPELSMSSLSMVFDNGSCACLAAQLDKVFPARPIVLSRKEMMDLSLSARSGRQAIRAFKLQANRGFDFKLLERLHLLLAESSDAQRGATANSIPDFQTSLMEKSRSSFSGDRKHDQVFQVEMLREADTTGIFGRATMADFTMTCALKSTNNDVVRFVVEKLGVASDVDVVELAEGVYYVYSRLPKSHMSPDSPV